MPKSTFSAGKVPKIPTGTAVSRGRAPTQAGAKTKQAASSPIQGSHAVAGKPAVASGDAIIMPSNHPAAKTTRKQPKGSVL